MKKLYTILAALCVTAVALAQSSPGFQYGQVPSVGQWNSYFSAKQDYYPSGIPVANGGTGAVTSSAARTNLGLGTMATQNSNAVSITGGSITGITVGGSTNLVGGAVGSVPYQNSTSTTAFLTGNSTTTPQFLTSIGTGSAAQAPSYTSSTGSGNVVLATSPTISSPTLNTPTMTSPTLGAATATTVNKVTITAPATGSTLTIADGKTLTANNSLTLAGTDGKTLTTSNSLTLAGTDGTTMTFPSTSASIARIDSSQTFSGTQTFSGAVAGTALSTYLASPPAIGGTAAAAGSFTTLSASSTVSGSGFSTYLASPPAIGGTAAAAGSFTTLSASSTVSGTGFSTYLASPPAIGGTSANTVKGTTVTATTGYNLAQPLVLATAPTMGSCGTGPTLSANNGPSAFRVTVGTSAGNSCVVNLPAATTGWNCFATNLSSNFGNMVKQSANTTTSVTLTQFTSAGAGASYTGGTDVLAVSCFAY